MHVGRDRFNATMRVATGEERSELWQQLVEVYSPYTAYQQSAGDREIPVVVLERA